MAHQETLSDIPDDEVEEVMEDFKDSGATKVTKTKQANGLWTVTATFADEAASDESEPDESDT
jgi:hypothetical protein